MAQTPFELPSGDAEQDSQSLQPSTALAQSLQNALRRRDATACCRLAEQAGGCKDVRAVEALCALLVALLTSISSA